MDCLSPDGVCVNVHTLFCQANLCYNSEMDGLSSSPYTFSKVSEFVMSCMVREGYIECINYLDDFCVVASMEEGYRDVQWVLVRILDRLGF